MTKQQFIRELELQLSPLDPVERLELLHDYEEHFAIGREHGKTEQEIARELGDPFMIAKEALGDRFQASSPPPPYSPPAYTPPYASPSAGAAVLQQPRVSNGRSRSVFAAIGLFFVHLIMLPLGLSAWTAWIGLIIGAVGLIAMPLLAVADLLLSGYFLPAKLSISVAGTGLGILVMLGSIRLARLLKKGTGAYFRWSGRTLRGDRKQ